MNAPTLVIALTTAGGGAFAASVVWATAWHLRIERAARDAEQQVFDAAAQQLTKVIGRARVPVYDVWERSALAEAEVTAELAMQLREAAAPPALAPTPVPSLAGTLLIVAQYLGQQSLRWMHVRVARLLVVLPQRRTPGHRGWDSPDGLAELQRLTARKVDDECVLVVREGAGVMCASAHGRHRAGEPVGVSQ